MGDNSGGRKVGDGWVSGDKKEATILERGSVGIEPNNTRINEQSLLPREPGTATLVITSDKEKVAVFLAGEVMGISMKPTVTTNVDFTPSIDEGIGSKSGPYNSLKNDPPIIG
ncbi:hypothetical protein Dsin_016782 [Dipteronia sinensis]|uniref:Uncharacterized protein n=1 Tax=Dipteronia sinensis TaxID=43782 RepID=A0AAE0E5U0_9ROSI|nr:hypothetical protein Dsin_016782 [Dipteronia sinensis]